MSQKPLSSHWADQTAHRMVQQLGDRESYTVASGITPSGTVHIGNFREVITVDLVARALRSIGKKVRFIYSWDDFDTFRKVPVNLPQQEMLKTHLRRPISRVPDPYGETESYSAGNIKRFESDLSAVGIAPEFLYQHKRYSAGMYAQEIRTALEKREIIRKILDQYRSEELKDDWLPTAIYCEKCDRDEMDYERYDGEWSYSYKCSSCGNETTTDIRTTKNLKLNWRTDWPMRWNFEKVDFEPGGKDHSSQGGSYDTAKEIVQQVWGRKPPIYLQYDFVSIKGMGGKMSSSAGVLITLGEALEVYDGHMVRWIFASQRPNHDFSLAFDQDVIKTYDEFDRAEEAAFAAEASTDPKQQLVRRNYELSMVGTEFPSQKVYRAPFRDLCSRLQICRGDIVRTRQRYYSDLVKTSADQTAFEVRCRCALTWLEKHAPEEYRYSLNETPVQVEMEDGVASAVSLLRQLVAETDLDAIPGQELNQKIYDVAIRGSGCDSKKFFAAVYTRLIGREQGPRLPGFLKEIGKTQVLALL
jgi:lysyl-tRNA synthetase class 1